MEVERLLKAELLAVGSGEVEVDVVNTKHMGVFVDVLKDRRRFKDLGSE